VGGAFGGSWWWWHVGGGGEGGVGPSGCPDLRSNHPSVRPALSFNDGVRAPDTGAGRRPCGPQVPPTRAHAASILKTNTTRWGFRLICQSAKHFYSFISVILSYNIVSFASVHTMHRNITK